MSKTTKQLNNAAFVPAGLSDVKTALIVLAGIDALRWQYRALMPDTCNRIETMIDGIASRNVRLAMYADLRDECKRIVAERNN